MFLQAIAQNLTENQWMYNSNVILWLGGVTIVLLGLWAWYITNKLKMPFGEAASYILTKESESIIFFIVILIFLFEGMMAASIVPVGETPPNPFARFGTHMLVNVFGAVCAMVLMRDLGAVFEKGIDWFSRVIRVVILGTSAYVSIWIPFLNASIMAGGLGEDTAYELYLYSKNPFTSAEEMIELYRYYGLADNYNPWAALSYVMTATVALTWVGVIACWMEGLRNMSSKERRGLLFRPQTKKDEKSGEKDEKKEEGDGAKTDEDKKNIGKAEENIRWLLRRMGYNNGDLLDKLVKAGKENLYSIKDIKDRLDLAASLASLRNEGSALDSNKALSDDDRNAKKIDLRTRIRKIMEGKPKEADAKKRGLGLTIRSENKK